MPKTVKRCFSTQVLVISYLFVSRTLRTQCTNQKSSMTKHKELIIVFSKSLVRDSTTGFYAYILLKVVVVANRDIFREY